MAGEQDCGTDYTVSSTPGVNLTTETATECTISWHYWTGQGYVCLFNAPTGAPLGPAGTPGHVGWAFLTDPSTGTWEFGANEGPEAGIGIPSKTWFLKRPWADVVKTFTGNYGTGTPPRYHAAGFYTSVSCLGGINVDVSSAAAEANRTVVSQQDETYKVPEQDCLSDAISDLNAFGVPLPYNNPLQWGPNNYYNNYLTGWSLPAAPDPAGPPAN